MGKCAVYIIRTADNFLYTGASRHLPSRIRQHQLGIKSFIRNKKRPFKLVHVEYFQTFKEAVLREKEIKGWRREKKEKLFSSLL
ncbi:hypothetical protein A3G67_02100 [Candidatus Roizmanbacteria bacterium RIFCSPLOWO2_12_FULL_40_12]|uniref:GIY-YIG domain-containing protein n=1 Tax=Candidatus Roizmanbacteria bacterium RIFCSPLOWO2_01_FULL_40_42 TaxID=1802066 RepID=A0A1F7J3M3_9BACT|nr:MAG: hypothetical protein A2779_01220 [Candidatus Roizmanbacteria bacterium RIFCSPHIGHO2_01_FULL_40_98]OGK28984.1 MAG: hypothetical protein A3C31_01860 [Candidatus Roizmanbacteria bacterium RIFCSPHIGHO2_02_FULL_40_53]OGK29550.1 MAG: hypothetical protein A2W49_03680 [Candidatus Roizmanbacteria bacterium RIFCSPHIGHO2_12_41_18]OGK37271.1 MAG: hypothetical protein A3E69_04160 [Candidatus Roizmanbacteria bacterium RIFCSPHIGHO2_12_FULL_40_130]OGK50213.1 MAG: hypothetical protein A3B50_00315 [Candi